MNRLVQSPYVATLVSYPYVFLDGLFSEQELNDIEKQCDDLGLIEGTVNRPDFSDDIVSHDEIDSSYRKSLIKMHHQNLDNAWFFKKLRQVAETVNHEYFQYDLTGFEHFQYTTYQGKGSKYDVHTDMFLGEKLPEGTYLTRKLSFSLILSDQGKDFEGGEFEFFYNYYKPECPDQKRGRLIVFPSYILHGVKPLITGTRKSIVFWVLGPKFK